MINEKLTCDVKSGLSGIPWLGGFTWANESSPSLDEENRKAGTGMSCTFEEFQRFEAFFSKFTSTARDYFLPPERQRFGTVSNRALLSFLGVGNSDTWSLMLYFTGCRNCSKILHEEDDLQNTLLMHGSLVTELEDEGHNLEPPLPANKPSIILFVDRSSELSKVRKKSKSALEIFRQLALHNQVSYQMMGGQNTATTEGLLTRTFPGKRSGNLMMEHSPPHGMVKFMDKIAVMVINEGGTVTLDNIAGEAQGTTAHDILSYLLQKKNPAFQKKAKISDLAREAGFQLLSDDFEVKIVDRLPSQKTDDQLERSLSSMLMSQESQIPKLPMESIIENNIDLNGGNLLKTITITGVEHDEPKFIYAEFSHNQEATANSDGNLELIPTEPAQEVMNSELGTAESLISYKDDHICKEKDAGRFAHCAEQPLRSEQDSPDSPGISFLEENIQKGPDQHTEWGSNDKSTDEASQDLIIGDSLGTSVIGNGAAEDSSSARRDKLEEHRVRDQAFKGSFFFSDGGYRLLRSLTADSKIPSVVILDPVLQQHYVFPEETVFSYSSLLYFVDSFMNGSLISYQRSESFLPSPRDSARPPFVNLDFHESDSIPRVTPSMFSEMILGFRPCDGGYAFSCSDNQNVLHAWRKDVLVLFTNNWCGFCQRMELVVREVYRAFKGYTSMKNESKNRESTMIQDNVEDVVLNELPHIFAMDCTLNDCSALLKSMTQREAYPALMLFPAEKKNGILYQGDISVTNIIEFIAAHGSNSHHLSENKGILWTRARKGDKSTNPLHDAASSAQQQTIVAKGGYHEVLLNSTPSQDDKHNSVRSHIPDGFHDKGQHLDTGSVLIATDKLLSAPPFDKSTVLIVKADKNEGFQGLIINKRIKWNTVLELNEESMPLIQAPLSFGGPLIVQGMPLLSFTRRATEEGYSEIVPSFYFGGQLATIRVIEAIRIGTQLANDYWFFLGYVGWGWNQLFDELAKGSWQVNYNPLEHLDWPES
ncbi:uncharacterized protein LOC143886828 isoform X2 [Tasmannia lanceolata]